MRIKSALISLEKWLKILPEYGSSATLLHKTWHSEKVLDGTDIVLLTQILYTKYKVKERLPLE